MYHVPVHPLARTVLEHIRRAELLHPGDRLGVAVSGGADSVALLRLLLALKSELGIVLSVVHLNHQLRGAESDADQQFVAGLAARHKLEFHSSSVDVARHAAQHRMSVEAAARQLRYEFFAGLFRAHDRAPLGKVATGHTLDDQAETVLMRLIRGTGMRGLSAIRPHLELESEDGESSGEIIRPLLALRRHELGRFLQELGQSWREDSTNRDQKLTRNRIRSVLLPLLERQFNPAIVEGLSELAEIAYGEEDFWENESAAWMGTRIHWPEPDWSSAARPHTSGLVQLAPAPAAPNQPHLDARQEPHTATVDLAWLLAEPLAVQRRAVKAIGDRGSIPMEFRHVDEVLRFAASSAPGKQLTLPLGWVALREPNALVFRAPDPRRRATTSSSYEYKLTLPGRAMVPELGLVVEAVQVVPAGENQGYDPEHLFDPSLLAGDLIVRNWRPGDRFWPAHTKSPRKIKELLQERHVSGPERALWPVIASGDEIVWVRGFPGRARFRPRNAASAILLREVPSGLSGSEG